MQQSCLTLKLCLITIQNSPFTLATSNVLFNIAIVVALLETPRNLSQSVMMWKKAIIIDSVTAVIILIIIITKLAFIELRKEIYIFLYFRNDPLPKILV